MKKIKTNIMKNITKKIKTNIMKKIMKNIKIYNRMKNIKTNLY